MADGTLPGVQPCLPSVHAASLAPGAYSVTLACAVDWSRGSWSASRRGPPRRHQRPVRCAIRRGSVETARGRVSSTGWCTPPLPERVVNGETPAVHTRQAHRVREAAVRDRQGSAGRPQDLRRTSSQTPCPFDSPAGCSIPSSPQRANHVQVVRQNGMAPRGAGRHGLVFASSSSGCVGRP